MTRSKIRPDLSNSKITGFDLVESEKVEIEHQTWFPSWQPDMTKWEGKLLICRNGNPTLVENIDFNHKPETEPIILVKIEDGSAYTYANQKGVQVKVVDIDEHCTDPVVFIADEKAEHVRSIDLKIQEIETKHNRPNRSENIKDYIHTMSGKLKFKEEVDDIDTAQSLIDQFRTQGKPAAATHHNNKHQVYAKE